MTSYVQCAALTNNGKGLQCTRKAVINGLCTQHNNITNVVRIEKKISDTGNSNTSNPDIGNPDIGNPDTGNLDIDNLDIGTELLTNDLPPELASTIMSYSENYDTSESTINKYLIEKVHKWYIRIGGRTPWSDISKTSYSYIIKKYENRISDYPVDINDYEEKINNYPFTSKKCTIFTKDIINIDIQNISINSIKKYLEEEKIEVDSDDLQRLFHIRTGDIININVGKKNYVSTFFIYDGANLIPIEESERMLQVPSKFDIATFPTTDYFISTIDNSPYVWLHNNVMLQKEFVELKDAFYTLSIYKFTRDDGIIIYTDTKDYPEFYKNNPSSIYVCDRMSYIEGTLNNFYSSPSIYDRNSYTKDELNNFYNFKSYLYDSKQNFFYEDTNSLINFEEGSWYGNSLDEDYKNTLKQTPRILFHGVGIPYYKTNDYKRLLEYNKWKSINKKI
jgi:hypothetical protein